MSMRVHLEGLYNYNYWANHRYLNTAASLTEEQLYHKQGNHSSTVHGTLLHMMSMEAAWLERWQGGAPKQEFSNLDFPTLLSIQESWTALEKNMQNFLAAQNDKSLQADTACIGFNGKPFHLLLWQMMAHVPNHNTHHRSELAAMFTIMDVHHPEDETIQYFLIQSGQRKE
jgi:uncharacterized damage-inducible protein DinB